MPRVISCLLADDVRYEANGKMLLVGLYQGDFAVSAFPIEQDLTPVLIIEDPAGLSRVFITISAASGAFSIGAEAQVQLNETVTPPFQGLMQLPPFPLRLDAPDEVIVRVGLQEGEPQTLVAKLRIVGADEEAEGDGFPTEGVPSPPAEKATKGRKAT